MSVHTPGPWKVIETTSSVDLRGVYSWQDVGPKKGWPCAIALGRGNHHEDAEIDANARLISAAPDMLAVLQDAKANNMLVECPDWWGRVFAAIAKASN